MLPSRTLFFCGLLLAASLPLAAWNSTRVPLGAGGQLLYPTDSNGNRIPDFSHAGYKGGGVALPDIPVVSTISPIAGDNTAAIQAAIDAAGALPLQSNGYRGRVLLTAGTYMVNGTLRVNKQGVVLSGVGNGTDPASNTILQRTGTSLADVITAGGGNDDDFTSEVANTRTQITTALVPVGSRQFEVANPALYSVGDNIVIFHDSTQAWLDAVDRGGVTDSNFWKTGEIDVRYHRYITAITGNTITIDAPVFMHLNRSLSQSVMYKYNRSAVITNVGLEKFLVDIVTAGPTSEDHAEDAITFIRAEDSWAREVTTQHFVHAGFEFRSSTRCTLERCRAIDPHSIVTGSRRYNFSTYHSQLILFKECFASLGRHAYVSNGTATDSGNVVLDSVTDRPLTFSEGHRRWPTGLLFDNITTTNRGSTSDVLGFYNRGTFGTGHGWGAAHSVIWNCNAAGGKILVQQPPTAQNYAIGCFGNVTGSGPFAGPVGFIEGANTVGLQPRSLYLEQLNQRLTFPQIVVQPLNQTIGTGHTISVTAAIAGSGPFTYQWQVSADGGTTWTNVSNGGAYSGATTATLTIEGAPASFNGNRYRYTATNGAGAKTSESFALTVTAPQFPTPASIAVDSSGNLYVADSSLHTIQKVTSAGVVSTLAGTAGQLGASDGTGSAAQFREPSGVAVDSSGNVFVADTGNATIRRITPAGAVTTIAGSALATGSTDNAIGTNARFSRPIGIATGPGGTLFVADTNNHTIRQINAAGAVTTFAGTAGSMGSANGTGAAATFNRPTGVAVDATGAVYVTDTVNHTIRKITPTRVVSTHAGLEGSMGSANGSGAAALFNRPTGIAVDASGSIYVTDTNNATLRKITSVGAVTTLAGLPGIAGHKDGVGSDAWFKEPIAAAVDASGTIWVADSGNAAIRKVTSTGAVSTVVTQQAATTPTPSPSPTPTPTPTPTPGGGSGGGGGGSTEGMLVLALSALALSRLGDKARRPSRATVRRFRPRITNVSALNKP